MTAVEVRRADEHDIAAIQRIGLRTWPDTYLPITGADYVITNLGKWWTSESVRFSILEEVTLVALVDGNVVGTATLGGDGGEVVIWKIYVMPSTQGSGIGTALMCELLQAAPQDRDVLVEFVDGDEHARRFYERFGFEPDRTEPGEYATTTVWYRRQAGTPPVF